MTAESSSGSGVGTPIEPLDDSLVFRHVTDSVVPYSKSCREPVAPAVAGGNITALRVAALVLIYGTWLWARRDKARARSVSTYGLLMLLLLFGAGFIAIGGEWFSMWQSKTWNGLEAATRVIVFTGFVLVVNHLPFRESDSAA